jgi:anthranilate synthase component 2
VHYIREHSDCSVEVYRNDKISLKQVAGYDRIVLSPGPGLPDEAGILKDLVRRYASTKKILGVCLGMQAIGEVFGGNLMNLQQVYHGVATPIYLEGKDDPVFEGIPDEFMAGRYHSWVIDEGNFPAALTITSRDKRGHIMSIRHKEYPVFGLQFHPESILTPHGKKIIFNFLNL